MFRLLLSTLLPFLFSCSSLVAQHLSKTLLWRISGNGLNKPSYLYGTMHVSDPRLFNLGDSLLQAISSSEGFANELDLNGITPMVVDMVNQQAMNFSTLKETLDKNDFKKYGPILAKKFNKPAEEITSFDIIKEKNKWIDDGFKGKKMQTFLDAYLADLAYRQGKWIGGIEDFSDQSGLFNSLIDESDIKQLAFGGTEGNGLVMEDMVTVYQNGDLDGLQGLLNNMDSSSRDVLLIRRNHKMALRMDSMSRVRTMVFAVGAAHLSGKEGLIDLLKEKGFSVDPVFSSKKIEPRNYTFPEIEKPWVEVNDPEGHYRVMMPGKPGDVNLFGVVNMAIYFNVFNNTWYISASSRLPYSQKAVDSLEGVLLRHFFDQGNFKEEKPLNLNGVPGKSYVHQGNDGYKKVYLLYKNNLLYYAVAYSASDTPTALSAIDKFFKSYQPIPVNTESNAGMVLYTDSNRAFKISTPVKAGPVNVPIATNKNNLNTGLFMATDPQTGSYYFFGFSEPFPGYSFTDNQSTVRVIRENLTKKFQNRTLDTLYKTDYLQILEMDGSMMDDAMRAKAKIILRGNRYYTLLIMYGPDKWNKTAEEVLASFQTMQYATTKWGTYHSPDSLFNTWVPGKIELEIEVDSNSGGRTIQYQSWDSNRANNYLLKIDSLDQYFWVKNDTLLWQKMKEEYTSYLDTVVEDRAFRKDGLYCYELFKKQKGSTNLSRIRFVLVGREIVRMISTQEPETIREENVNRFFDYFQFNHTPPATDVFESKAVSLLQDLRSPDSSLNKKARTALSKTSFDLSNLTLLQNALMLDYPSDSTMYRSVNEDIAERIITLNDSISVEFAKAHLDSTTKPEVKMALLSIIGAYHTKPNYESLGRILMLFHSTRELPYSVFGKWYDSLRVTANLFPTILPLLHDSVLVSPVINIASKLLDSSLLYISLFKTWEHTLLNYSEQRFRQVRADSGYFSGADYSLLNLLQRFNDPSSNAMMKKWLGANGNEFLKQQIVLYLLENNQMVGQQTINDLASNPNTRVGLYGNLKKCNRTNLFPSKYKTQKYFAESLALEEASDYGDDEAEITLIKSKELQWKGVRKRFFFYDVVRNGDNEHWLSVVGPFSLNPADVSYSDAKVEINYDEQYSADEFDSQAKILIDRMQSPESRDSY